MDSGYVPYRLSLINHNECIAKLVNSFIEAQGGWGVLNGECSRNISAIWGSLSAYVDIFLPGRTTYSEEATRGRVTSANKYNAAEPIVSMSSDHKYRRLFRCRC